MKAELVLGGLLAIGCGLTFWVKDDVNAMSRDVQHTLHQREVHHENFPDSTGSYSRPEFHEIPRRLLLRWHCEEGVNCQPMSQGPR